MHLIEVFLPLTFPDGTGVPESLMAIVQAELTERFGGVTVYARAPADGVWKGSGGVERDALVVLEIMTDELDKDWWSGFRHRGEALFRQEELVIRATRIDRL